MFLRRSFAPATTAFTAVRSMNVGSLLPDGPDPEGLREFSVVYTDRATNHMSKSFQQTMKEVNSELKSIYKADQTILIPGSGSYGMEAVARQFATGNKVLVIRNGWFSYRWTQIFEAAGICKDHTVMKAQFGEGPQPTLQPPCVDKVVAEILASKPAVVFAPHVETSAGVILPNSYISKVSAAVRSVGGLFVLDGIASGTAWVDMAKGEVDIYITAPQKGWSGPAGCGIVMMNNRALEKMEKTNSSSFCIDLKKWNTVMNAYLNGGHMYHATMPTDAISSFNDLIKETKTAGYQLLEKNAWDLGNKTAALLESKGAKVLAHPDFRSPGVVVAYTKDGDIQTGKKFASLGVQIAGGVPLQCDEGADFKTFRIGLFGLDKLTNVDTTIASLDKILTKALGK